MLKLQVVDAMGSSTNMRANPIPRSWKTVRGAGLPMEAICGGSLACATCHVIVAEEYFALVGQSSEDEEDMLDQGFDITRTSRLGLPDQDGRRTLTACEYDCRHGDNAARYAIAILLPFESARLHTPS